MTSEDEWRGSHERARHLTKVAVVRALTRVEALHKKRAVMDDCQLSEETAILMQQLRWYVEVRQ